ncbi:putative unspecific monooxygenase [Dioscorea sansibarensis]
MTNKNLNLYVTIIKVICLSPIFVYWIGNKPALYVSQKDLVRDISLCVSLDLGKPVLLQKAHMPLFGKGILKANGMEWFHQRKLIAPEFFMDKVKSMVELMVESVIPLIDSWESKAKNGGGVAEIIVDEDFRNLSADVISRASFGSNYAEGREIFEKLRVLSLTILRSNNLFDISYLRYLPTKRNKLIKKLEKETASLILNLVKERKEDTLVSSRKDFLTSLLESVNTTSETTPNSSSSTDCFIVDNCKNIYYAGHETIAVTATWCLMLLASYPKWQALARQEVMELCKGQPPNADMIQKMKTLTMVIQETLRLYPPASFIARETFKEMKFGDVCIPKGINIWIPVSTMHQDMEIWGIDAGKFNPERFVNGVSSACNGHGYMYMPFGFGARTCLGLNFAMVELKVMLSMLLMRFTFALSPQYCHSPAFRLIVEPEFGVHLIVKRV